MLATQGFAIHVTNYEFSMLAVMTLNVGYYLSILGGAFVGELAVGRYVINDNSH